MRPRLIYLSPVAWHSFAQRPHRFVRWWQAQCGGEVLWLDPYPTRLPALSDLRRLRGAPDHLRQPTPEGIQVLPVPALPLEPLPGGAWLNRLRWRSVVARVLAFAAPTGATLGIGKPSALALQLLQQGRWSRSFYDAMDDFPAFFSGLSQRAARRREQEVASQVQWLMASSTALLARWSAGPRPVQLVANGLDSAALPEPVLPRAVPGPRVLGYVGTLSGWFDWHWVARLAQSRPQDEVRLIGPLYVPSPVALPANVVLRPALDHAQALRAMQEFDVGLIPFQRTPLTESVDPIKYYEYRALGLPVLSTPFGEMREHGDEPGCFLVSDPLSDTASVQAASDWRDAPQAARAFAQQHDWAVRFAPLAPRLFG